MIFRTASIHGRFQPFHNGHLAYLQQALSKAELVYVGLTRVLTNPGIGSEVAPHRLSTEANPLSYFERCQVIQAALSAEGIEKERYTIGPFPIEEPERLPEFWPIEYICMTTVVDRWNEEKIRFLREQGYQIEILSVATGETVKSGTRIREAMRAGSDEWRLWTPRGSHELLVALQRRLGG